MEDKDLIGKIVKDIEVDGFGLEIVFTDGTKLVYAPSDGGYSSWDVVPPEEETFPVF